MCFGSTKVKMPDPPAPPPTPKTPLPPKPPAPPRELKIKDTDTAVRSPEGQSRRQREGMSRGTSRLRIPLNIGTPKSGGLNV